MITSNVLLSSSTKHFQQNFLCATEMANFWSWQHFCTYNIYHACSGLICQLVLYHCADHPPALTIYDPLNENWNSKSGTGGTECISPTCPAATQYIPLVNVERLITVQGYSGHSSSCMVTQTRDLGFNSYWLLASFSLLPHNIKHATQSNTVVTCMGGYCSVLCHLIPPMAMLEHFVFGMHDAH